MSKGPWQRSPRTFKKEDRNGKGEDLPKQSLYYGESEKLIYKRSGQRI